MEWTIINSGNRVSNIWQLIKGYRGIYTAAVTSMAVAATARSASYLLLGYLVDQILQKGKVMDVLVSACVGFLALSLIEGICTFWARINAARTSEGIAMRMRDRLFDHIQHLPYKYHDQIKTGELIQRSTSDVDEVRRLFADQLINAGRILSTFVVNFVVLFIINWRLTLQSIIIVPFVLLFAMFFFKKISDVYESFQEQEAILSAVLQENLSGVRVVKAFARQSYEIEKFGRENLEKYKRGKHLMFLHALFWPVSDVMIGLQMLLGFYLAALSAIHGEITPGMYMSFAGMLIWILWPIRNLGQLIVEMSRGLVSFHRVMAVVLEKREDLFSGISPSSELKGDIEFRDVCFAYNDRDTSDFCSENHALKNISFVCHAGDVIALMGSTGSGKTTLANLLGRFYDYTEGNVILDGKELKEYSRSYLRRQIGIVEQEPFLFSRSIRENIAYGVSRPVGDDEIVAAAKTAAIHEVIQTFPDGYSTIVGEKGVTLSGGQKQRIVIARTLVKNPRILILDDATSSVDSETESEIRNALENLMQERTTFVIAHRIQSLISANLILVMDQGRIVQRGTHNQLIAEDGIYRNIYHIQTQIDLEMEREVNSLT